MPEINMDVIKAAYGFTIDANGELLGLAAGDMGYEPTGINLEGDTLKIWQLGCEAWGKLCTKPEDTDCHANNNGMCMNGFRCK